jgi:hypothetical protein
MTYLTSNMARLRVALFVMVAAGAGCATKNDSLGGTGGGGTGGATQSGGAPGTGGGTGGANPSDLQAMLTAAEATWVAAKPSCPIYAYERYQSSVFGSCGKTTIEMENGQPIRRSYVSCAFVPDGGTVDKWDEIGAAQIGTHNEGAGPETVEQLFADCQTVLTNVEANPSGYNPYASFNAEGAPLVCQAQVIQCIDDCTDGFRLDWFTCEASPSGDAGFNPG